MIETIAELGAIRLSAALVIRAHYSIYDPNRTEPGEQAARPYQTIERTKFDQIWRPNDVKTKRHWPIRPPKALQDSVAKICEGFNGTGLAAQSK